MSRSGTAVTGARAHAYRVPTEHVEADGTLSWCATEVVVVTVSTADVAGLGWTYAHHTCAELVRTVLDAAVRGHDVLDAPAAWQAMRAAVRNHGRPGLVSCAMSAVDIAIWDAAARSLGIALSRLLGRAHEAVPVYGSGGFTTESNEQLCERLRCWIDDQGVQATKIKIGESWGSAPARDLERVELARDVVGPNIELYVDANGAYSIGQATRLGRALDELDVRWFEEPVSSDDLSGLRRVRNAVDADVAAGEYGYDLPYFDAMLEAEAVDCLQVDVTRCGGIGEWRRAAALAEARNRDVSAHCAQNLAAHVAVTTNNIRHMEWFRDHERIEKLFFDGVLEPRGGLVRPDVTAVGHGMTFKDADAEPYRVSS